MRRFAVVLMMVFVLLVTSTPVLADDSEIHVTVDRKVGETYESILIFIESDMLPGPNNTTRVSNHTVHVELQNTNTGEVIISQTVKLAAGVGTLTFYVDPIWGEFLALIKVYDAQLDSEAVTSLEVRYSTDYLAYLIAKMVRAELDEDNRKQDEQIEQNTNLVISLIFSIFTLIPFVILRIEHTAAHMRGEESLYDHFRDRVFNYTITIPSLWHYMHDEKYPHARDGRGPGEAAELLATRLAVENDLALLLRASSELKVDIQRLDPESVAIAEEALQELDMDDDSGRTKVEKRQEEIGKTS